MAATQLVFLSGKTIWFLTTGTVLALTAVQNQFQL